MNPGVGVEKIAAVDEENPFSLLAGLLDKGRAPGQTAKQKVFSAAGLDFSEHVRGENDGKVFSRPGVGGLRPAGSGGQESEQKNSENLAQENLLKKDRSAERRQTKGLGFVFIQNPGIPSSSADCFLIRHAREGGHPGCCALQKIQQPGFPLPRE